MEPSQQHELAVDFLLMGSDNGRASAAQVTIKDWSAQEAWAGTRRPIMTASSLPAEAYADARFFAEEMQSVFGSSWVCVGFAGEATENRMLVREAAGQSLVITRTSDGEVHAFRNACRHRGTELAEADCDVKGTIRCPYHRWCYTLDGTLVRTPMFDEAGVEDFDYAEFGLHEVRAATWGCLLFVCLDPDVPAIDDYFGDLDDRLAGYRLADWWLHDGLEIEINANWKLISENFSEYYHLPFVHPNLIKVSRVEDHYRYQGRGMYLAMTTTPVSSDERNDWSSMPPAAGLGESDEQSGRFITLFPNVLLSILPNHTFVMILEPIAPGVTRERCGWVLPPSTTELDDDDFDLTRTFWIDVNNEDVDIVEKAQRGLTKGGFEPGRLSPRFEEPLHRFHNMLADKMTGIPRIPDGDPSDVDDILGSGVNPLPYLPSLTDQN